jgi:serine/threonine protein kinase
MQWNHDNTISGLDQDTGELLAVKEMGVTADEGNMRTLCREIELMMRLEHENCVAIRGAEVKQDPKEGLKLYALFEWVPGGSLHALLGKFSKFNESVVAIYLRQILCGLAYLHANGIFHRDLKGENVLLDESGRVKLADFGESTLASDEAHRTAAAAVKPGSHKRSGTPYFMAPEIMARNEYTAAADVWSVGGVALELATGQPPWKELNFARPRDLFEVGAVVGTRRVAREDRARLFTTRSDSRLSDYGAWRARRRESPLLFTHNTISEIMEQQQSAPSPQSVEQVVSPPPPVVTAAPPVAPIAEDYFEEPLGGLSCDSYLAYLCPDAFLESQQPNRLTLHACIVASLMKNADQSCGRWATASISARKTCSLVRGQELEALPELKQCSKHWRTEAAQRRAECLVINQVNVTTGAPYSSGLADPCTHAIEQLITNESASAACRDKSSDSNWKKCAIVSVQQLQAHTSRLGPDAAMMYWSQFEHIYSRYGQPSEPVLRAPPVIATDVSQYSQPGPICLRPLRWQQKDLSRIYYVPGAHGLMDFTLSIWVRAERSTDPLCSAKDAAGAEFWFDGCSIASAVPGDYPSTSWASFQTREFRMRRAAGVKGAYMKKAQFHSGGAGPMMNDWGLTVMNDGSVAFGVGHRRFVSPALTYSFAPQR